MGSNPAGRATVADHAAPYARVAVAGKAGAMPAKGGRTDLSGELIKQCVDYLVSEGRWFGR